MSRREPGAEGGRLVDNPYAQPGVGVPRSVFTQYPNFDGPDRGR